MLRLIGTLIEILIIFLYSLLAVVGIMALFFVEPCVDPSVHTQTEQQPKPPANQPEPVWGQPEPQIEIIGDGIDQDLDGVAD